MTVDEIRSKHQDEVRAASDTLRKLRKLPDDQDIDHAEAVALIHHGEEIDVLLAYIAKLESETW